MSNNLQELLIEVARSRGDATAIAAPGRQSLSYSGLVAHMNAVERSLRNAGIGRNERVAVILPNGPEMATAFLGVAAHAVCAPLNPAYRETELDFFLKDLEATALIIDETASPAALASAKTNGLRVIQLTSTATAGAFTLHAEGKPSSVSAPAAGPDDRALMLHTSGTTSRPKLVPLRQGNLVASARHIRESLALTANDRCLNVMPLFHIHGLVGALLSSLSAGASVVCNPGFAVDTFWKAFAEYQPTWYTAVPTMHFAVVDAAEQRPELAKKSSLRFIRSCSARLPEALMHRLEAALAVPVVEAFGMTEAAHQVGCNPLPPRQRKPNSIGVPTGVDVAIMAPDGALLRPNEQGEMVLRGPNVMSGYEANPDANAKAFTDGWFRTGDRAFIDPDGYIFVTGRIKELVNRGGEKVAPSEVDEALVKHPAVAQAVAFAAPHPTLGEDVAVAIVVKPGAHVTAPELRAFAAANLAEFKVPGQYFFVTEIPKGPTGKIQRLELARILIANVAKTPLTPPRNPIETALVELWMKHLRHEAIGINDNFFQKGGDSLIAVNIVTDARAKGLALSPALVLEHPTIAELGEKLAGLSSVKAEADVPVGPMPIMHHVQRLLNVKDPSFMNSAVLALKSKEPLSRTVMNEVGAKLLEHHDGLRVRFRKGAAGWEAEVPAQTLSCVEEVDVGEVDDAGLARAIKEVNQEVCRRWSLAEGPLVKLVIVHAGRALGDYLLVCSHHAAKDVFCNELLAQDIDTLYRQLTGDATARLPAKTSSLRRFAEHSVKADKDDAAHAAYWARELAASPWPRHEGKRAVLARGLKLDVGAPGFDKRCAKVGCQIGEAALMLLGSVLGEWVQRQRVLMYVITSGRVNVPVDIDLSRTAGCFSYGFPVAFDLHGDDGKALGALQKKLREASRISDSFHRVGYETGLPGSSHDPTLQIRFNFRGVQAAPPAHAKLLRFELRKTRGEARELRVEDADSPALVQYGQNAFTDMLRVSVELHGERFLSFFQYDDATLPVDVAKRLATAYGKQLQRFADGA